MTSEQPIPYRQGSGLACVSMVLAHLDYGEHLEDEFRDRLGITRHLESLHLPPEERAGRLDQDPDAYVRLLQSYGVGSRVRTDGRVSRLCESLDNGRDVIVFLGAKALRKRALRKVKTADAGYQPVVVTQAGRWRVVFHDPDPVHGRENRSVRRGRHVFYQWISFENLWSVWQGNLLPMGYLTTKMPDLSPSAQLRPWVFIEAWRP